MMLEIIDLLYGQNNRGVTRYMRSGSPANDGSDWSSAQHPHSDETLGSQGRYGSGARSEPQDALGSGRREAPFGPEVSWPYGFRKLDPESREVLESAYGTGPAYQQPAMDDFGYGDPGYSDPSYEGPKTPYANPAFPDTRFPRSVIPPRSLTRGPAMRPPAASRSRSRRCPAAAMRSGRSPGPR